MYMYVCIYIYVVIKGKPYESDPKACWYGAGTLRRIKAAKASRLQAFLFFVKAFLALRVLLVLGFRVV